MITNAKCPFCSNKRIRYLQKIRSPINGKDYTLCECKKCLLQFYTPLVFEDVYETEIVSAYKGKHEKIEGEYYSWTEKLIELVKKRKINLKNKKVLDIGAGDGNNWVRLKEEKLISPEKYYALELDKKSLDVCKKRGIVNTINSYFDSDILKKIKFKFDVIIATEVFEHQIKPKEFIATSLALLKEKGLLIISVPNVNRRLFKFGYGDVPPHHFLKFSTSFFKRNFNNIIFINRYTKKNSNIIAKNISKKVFATDKFNLVFYPLAFIIKWEYFFSPGQGIIVCFQKN
jgi:2-polyprenyl-3-methyl-5-hydroxy-6-metoxy-1,4-benzoquinol methylase